MFGFPFYLTLRSHPLSYIVSQERARSRLPARSQTTFHVAEALPARVLIARGNVPAVRLVPVVPRGRRHFGALKGKIAMDPHFDEPLPDDELAGWNLG